MTPTSSPVLFYDDGCGPCTLFARAARALSLGRLSIAGLTSEEADSRLGGLDPSARFGSMHLRRGDTTFDHAEALLPLVGAVFGSAAARGMTLLRPAESGLRLLYSWLYDARMKRGCAVPSGRSGAVPSGSGVPARRS